MIMKKLLTLAVSILFSIPAFSQTNADLEVTFVNPAAGDTITIGSSLEVHVIVKNLGPDTLKANQDTVFFGFTGLPTTLYKPQGIIQLAPGDTTQLVLQITLTAGTLGQGNFCAWAYARNTVRNNDPNNTNDTVCNSVYVQNSSTYIAGNPENDLEFVQVYPNPVDNVLNIDLSKVNQSEPIQLRVTSIGCRTTKTKTYELNTFSSKESIDVSGFPAGVYMVELRQGANIKHIKMLKR